MFEGLDANKDQSYFLALMNQHQVHHARFPIGHLKKQTVREIARQHNLPNAEKKDSQGICFIGQIKMADFLKHYVKPVPGDIVDQRGRLLGQHEGLHLFTLGQRKGIGIASNMYKENYVVVEKRAETNELVIAFDRPDTPHLYAQSCLIRHLHFINQPVQEDCALLSRPRYRAPAQKVRYMPESHKQARIIYEKPQRALAPGQICALYNGSKLLGGGIFSKIEYEM